MFHCTHPPDFELQGFQFHHFRKYCGVGIIISSSADNVVPLEPRSGGLCWSEEKRISISEDHQHLKSSNSLPSFHDLLSSMIHTRYNSSLITHSIVPTQLLCKICLLHQQQKKCHGIPQFPLQKKKRRRKRLRVQRE